MNFTRPLWLFMAVCAGACACGACAGAAPAPSPIGPSALDQRVIAAVIAVESGGNERAVSRRGCIGLMQVSPRTGRALGYTRRDLFDPAKNVAAGTAYLLQMLELSGGDIEKTLRKYNCGPGRWRGRACLAYARKVMARI